MNTIYTAGYARWTPAALHATVSELHAKLLDIRYSPRSQRPEWERSALQAVFGALYRHEAGLGNRNYKSGGPIELAAPQVAMGRVEVELDASPIVLLCGCYDVQICHRKVAAEFLAEWLGGAIVHLNPPAKKEQPAPSTVSSLLDKVRDKDQRFFLRMYLRSNMEVDQEIARARCAHYGIDYEAAYREVQRERI